MRAIVKWNVWIWAVLPMEEQLRTQKKPGKIGYLFVLRLHWVKERRIDVSLSNLSRWPIQERTSNVRFAGALHRDLKGEKSDKQLLYIIANSCRAHSALSAPFPPLWVHRDVYELHIVAYRFLYKTIEASHFCRTVFWPLIVAVVGHPWFLDAPKLFSRVPVGTECLKIQPSSTIQIVHSRICIHHCSRVCRNTSSLARP